MVVVVIFVAVLVAVVLTAADVVCAVAAGFAVARGGFVPTAFPVASTVDVRPRGNGGGSDAAVAVATPPPPPPATVPIPALSSSEERRGDCCGVVGVDVVVSTPEKDVRRGS